MISDISNRLILPNLDSMLPNNSASGQEIEASTSNVAPTDSSTGTEQDPTGLQDAVKRRQPVGTITLDTHLEIIDDHL